MVEIPRKLVVIWFLSLSISITVQEDTIQKWIDKLHDDHLQTRDQAQAMLIEIGEPALPSLQKLLTENDLEAKARAEYIIKQIKENLQIARSYPGPTLINLIVQDEKGKEHKVRLIPCTKKLSVSIIGAEEDYPVGLLYFLKSDVKIADVRSVKFNLTPLYKKTVAFKSTNVKLPE